MPTLPPLTDTNPYVRLHYDTDTNERGLQVRVINRTGGASVKGTLVAASTAADREVIKEANMYDTIGVVYEAGVAEGSEMWIWIQGVAQVLYVDSTGSTRGYVAVANTTDGRASDIDVPSVSPADAEHFREIGHVLETKSGGTNVLVLVMLHFN